MKNFYSILEISPDATKDQVKSQYRQLVKECHPDQYLEPHVKLHYEEKLKEINQAYASVLQFHLSSNSQVNSNAVSRQTLHSNISTLMGMGGFFILLILVIILAFPETVFSKVTDIEYQKQMVETVSKNQKQLVLQSRSSHNEIPSQIPKIIVQTPKLGSTVQPIAPLHIRAMYRAKK